MFRRMLLMVLLLCATLVVARTVVLRRGWLRSECPAEAKLRQVLPEVHFKADDIHGAAESLSRISGAKIIFTKGSRYDAGAPHPIELRLKDVRLAQVLERIVKVRPEDGLTYVAQGDSIVIAMPADLPQTVSTRTYDIADLLPTDDTPQPPPPAAPAFGRGRFRGTGSGLFGNVQSSPPPAAILPSPRHKTGEELASLIVGSVAVGTWSGNNLGSTSVIPGSIASFGGQLIVTQTPAVHWQIQQYLDGLRRRWGKPERQR